jgi:hypothetical protein
MLVDRHRTAAVIALSRVPVAERAAHQEALEMLLVHLYQSATSAAREAFRKRMDPLPQSQKPWGALDRPSPTQWLGLGPPVPAVLILLLGQQDDDPDSAEDGNRLPDRDSKGGETWIPLYAALDRWDTDLILQHIGPAGWQVPTPRPVPLDEGLGVELVPLAPVFTPITTAPQNAPAPSSGSGANGDGTGNGQTSPPSNGTGVATPPARPPTPLWRQPAVLASGAVVLTLGGLAVYALSRSRSPATQPVPELP